VKPLVAHPHDIERDAKMESTIAFSGQFVRPEAQQLLGSEAIAPPPHGLLIRRFTSPVGAARAVSGTDENEWWF
jgi:hypothetical protein